MAEYSFLPLPHIEIRKNIGINSNSQNKKNMKKSKAVNTPITAPCNARSHIKCSLVLSVTFHEANTATSPSIPVSKTSGALSPSTPKKYSTRNGEYGKQDS